MENIVSISGLNKWYGTFHVLKDIDLTVKPKERIVIAGPSGSGKSTLIRCINRLEEHQRGKIVVDGVELTNNLEQIEAIRREVGMVFQHFNLFPHLTILENCILAPMWVRKMPRKEAVDRAMYYLGRVSAFRSRPTSTRASFPVASSSVWPLPARCVCSQRSCCSTSRRRA